MNIFYELNKKYEWRSLAALIFAAFVVSIVVVSVYPLLESGHTTIVKETERRALYMAKQIAEKNSPFLAAHAETKTDIGNAQNGEGVQAALLVDLENRILAPGEKMNQYLTSGAEAVAAVQASKLFRNGRETGFTTVGDDSMIVAIEPVKILNPAMGRNITVAMAIVSIDSSLFTPDMGEIGMVYSQTLILAGILAILIALILHRMTLRPFMVLNEDMDKALKGDLSQISHEYKLLEVNSLWEIINSAIQRIPKGKESEAFGGSGVGGGAVSVEEYVKPLKALGDVIKVGIVVFDSSQKIAQMNSVFEEISGIHADQAIGHDMSEVARDQAMGAFTSDILNRTPVGGEGILEEFEISGMPFKVYACAFGSPGVVPHCYVMVTTKEVS